MAARQTVMLQVGVVLSLTGLTHCFHLFSVDETSDTHYEIIRRAVLKKTAEVCRDIAAFEGRAFNLKIDDNLSVSKVQKACSSTPTSTLPLSTDMFQTAIHDIYYSNAGLDLSSPLTAECHFDLEAFLGGRDIITTGVLAVKASSRLENFVQGRRTLGRVCRTLQDFYSHSNWVELGKTTPYSTLIRPDKPLENMAGYFSSCTSANPAGKCCQSSLFDKTSEQDPAGGINKDAVKSSHGSLQKKAADLAVRATMELLEDIRVAGGDKTFLRLMGLYQSSVLCFVIDTTGSMSDDIAEAQRVSISIIDSLRGTPQEPSYILVSFNDPAAEVETKTADADAFTNSINNIAPRGGGDIPEFSLTGLQLALTSAPPSSMIFVFTDAPAKDAHLKNTIKALIENTKSVVTFILTKVLASQRDRRDLDDFSPRNMNKSEVQLYRDLAYASGGLTIEVTKSEIPKATAVIEDSLASAEVTVFQVDLNPGRPENCNFNVDGLVSNMIVYITGESSLTFRLTSSTGVSQSSSQLSGPLASITTVGNLRRLSLSTGSQTGQWEISVNSNNPYSVKVTGRSSVNFIYHLVDAHEGAYSALSLKEGRPTAGGNVNLLVTVTGSDSVTVTDVSRFDSSGQTEVSGSLQALGSGNFLVKFSGVPADGFVVRLRGQDSSSTSRSRRSSFQRQASTQIKTSSISVTAQADNINIEPGSTISIPFTVFSDATGTFTVRANNNHGFASTLTPPGTVTIGTGSGGKANGIVTLTAPASTTSGTDVTLTIEAENAATTDMNYVVLRFSVVAKVTDLAGPVCQVVNISGICPASSSLCASFQWQFSANLTDGINGTGIVSATIRQGNGTLNTSRVTGVDGETITVVIYSASCCSQNVMLAAVDRVGNVGTCVGQARALTTPPSTNAFNTASTRWFSLSLSYCLWISVVVSLLWK